MLPYRLEIPVRGDQSKEQERGKMSERESKDGKHVRIDALPNWNWK